MVDPPPPAKTEALPDPGVRFSVVYADEDLVVVNKPAGLVVHPARGHQGGTLVNGLLALGLFSPADVEAQGNTRPGIVHRLDKGTSGILVVARTPFARDTLIEQFRCHSITRVYEAVVVGEARSQTFDTLHGRHPSDRLRFTTRVREGKRAVTHVRVLGRLRGATHVECVLETGRTHQIRVHLADAGTPVLGDAVYGKPPRDARVRAAANQISRPALHARLLEFVHPRTRERMKFEASLPPDLIDALRQLS
jgi:23S rRNA pseudouridine1911/1915/1917 synthase